MTPLVTSILAAACSLCGLVVTVPQMLRVVRTGSSAGVSLPGWVSWCVSYLAWVLFLAGTGPVQLFIGTLATSSVCFISTAVILRNATSYSDRAWWTTGLFAAAMAAALVLFELGHPAVVSVLLCSSPFWTYGPSAWKAWRCADVSGIATGTWVLAFVGAVLFATAGHTNTVTLINGSAAATLALSILVRLLVGHLRTAARHVEPVLVEL